MQKNKILILCLSVAIFSGCGGSSNDKAEGIIIHPEQPIPEPEPVVMGEGASYELAKKKLISFLTKSIEMSRIARNVIQNNASPVEDSVDCFDSRTILQHADNDSSETLSAFDSIDVEFENCFLASIDQFISGTMRIEISQISDDQQNFTVAISVSQSILGFQGQFALKYSHDLDKAQTEIKLQQPITIDKDGKISLTASGIIRRTEDYRTARYNIDITSVLSATALANDLTISVSQPIWGFLDEPPSQGELTITGDNGHQASLIIAGTSDSEWASWVGLTRLSTWGYNNDSRTEYGPNVNRTIYREVAVLTPLDTDHFPTENGVLTVLMSRLTELHVGVFGGEPNFFAMGEVAEEHRVVEASVEIEGAKIIVTPLMPLQPSVSYNVSGFFVSPSDTVTDIEDMEIQPFSLWLTTASQ